MKNIAIFASGSGSNAENIALHFTHQSQVKVSLILTNNPSAMVIERAKKLNIPCVIFSRNDFYNTQNVESILKENCIDWIVLAGFLWLIPPSLVKLFKNKMVNIHPALLPKYGGKGMYGQFVHQAVVNNGDTESGITIHWVNEHYDEGDVIFQAKCPVLITDTADDVAKKVHQLEYNHYPAVIEQLIMQQ
jgi:phosphoribosylglycinamide formyltransferase 1